MSPKTTTLDSGLRIVSYEMPQLQTTSLGIWVKAGARNERAEQNGIAHYLEHMAFKGTSRRSALQARSLPPRQPDEPLTRPHALMKRRATSPRRSFRSAGSAQLFRRHHERSF